MRIKFYLIILIAALVCSSANAEYTYNPFTGKQDYYTTGGVTAYTVATLPASPTDGDIAVVTDGADASDCSSGGGTDLNVCIYDEDGTQWVIAGDGAGSGNAFSTHDTPAGTDPVASGADTLTWDDTAPIVITGDSATDTITVSITDAASDGSTKGAATFTAADFNAASGVISIDYTNAQMATNAQPGFATAAQITALEAVDTEAELEALLELQDLQGAVTDAQVPNDITIDLSTLATTLTVSDNESTDEENAVLFTSAGDVDGGNLGIESDGDLTYNPSTGTLSATIFSGSGESLTWADGKLLDLSGITMSAATDEGLVLPGWADEAPATDKPFATWDATAKALKIYDGGWITLDPTGAPTDATYVVLGLNGTLSNEVVLTAGEGLDLTSATISGEDASTTNKGIASFDADDFDVTAGAVSIDTTNFTLNDLTFDVGSVDKTEFGFLNGMTGDPIQTQLDARCLESVFGTGLNADDLVLTGTDLELAAEVPHVDANETVSGNWTHSGTLALNGEVTMGADFNLNAHEIQSTGNVVFQLGDNAGTNKISVQDSDGVEVFAVNSDGVQGGLAVNNPYTKFDENDGTDYWIGIYDTTVDRLEIRRSETVNTNVDAYFDSDGFYAAGNVNIAAAHTYQIAGTQINIGNLGAGGNWTPTGTINFGSATLQNVGAGTVTDGSNYTTVSNSANDDTINELFAAIDSWASGVSAGTLVSLSDVGGDNVYTAGYLIIGDGSDSYDPKAVSGDITLGSDGAVTIANDAVTFAKIDDDGNFGPFTGAWDFTGGTLEIPNSDDPDTSAVGQIALDTDGWLRIYNGSAQYGMPITETIHVTVVTPNDLADATRDAFVFWRNTSGMSFVVTHWYAESDTDDTTLNIEETDADGANNATVDAVEIATDGTGIYTADDGTITAATIEDGHRLLIDFDDTDDPGQVKLTIVGYYNGDVN